MQGNVIFEELGKEERKLLLKAFDYDVDPKGYILDRSGAKIPSKEIPSTFLKVDDATLVHGSLKVIDGTPASISKFIREEVESDHSEP